MYQKNHKFFLCQHVSIKYLLSFFFLKQLLTGKKITVYFLISGKVSDFFEKKSDLISIFFFNRINITPFPYNLTKILTSDNRAFFDAVYFDSTYQIVDAIESTLLNSKKSITNHLNKKLRLVRNEIRLWVKQAIIIEIYHDVMLIELSDWLSVNPASKICGSNVTAIVNKVSFWSKFISDFAKKRHIDFVFFQSRLPNLRGNIVIIYLFNLINLCHSTRKRKQKDFLSNPPNSKGKISVCHGSMGNFAEYDRRNYYLFWQPTSNIDPDRILIFTRNSLAINKDQIDKVHAAGFNILSCDRFLKKKNDSIKQYKVSLDAFIIFFKYSVEMVRLLLKVRSFSAYKEWHIIACLLTKLPYWEDFFARNNIKINFRPGGGSFSYNDVALKLSKGTIVSYHYSNLSKFAILHHDCSDIYFVWGKKYIDIFKNNHSIVSSVIQTGYIFDYNFKLTKEKAWKLRKKLINKGADFIIGIFDESMGKSQFTITESMKKNYLNLYRSLFEYAIKNQDIGLIIKPKKEITRSVLESSEVTSTVFLALMKKGKVLFLDHNKLPVEAGKASDIIVGMVLESTSALECSFAGTPSVLFNGTGQKGMNTDYDWGKNKVIFDDIGAMITSIDNYKKNPQKSDGFGDWSPVIDEKDPFRDGRARDRMGGYMKVLFENINKGMSKERAIELASEKYKKKYGPDKVTFFKKNDQNVEILDYRKLP